MVRVYSGVLASAMVLVLTGCGPTDEPAKDAGADGAPADSGAVDVVVDDSGALDSATSKDTSAADTSEPDTTASDTATSDTNKSDTGKSDTSTSDTQTGSADAGCQSALDCPTPDKPCAVATCDKSVCGVGQQDDGAACSDGDPCTLTATCEGGACKPIKTKGCDDADPCTVDSCLPTGACEHKPGNPGAACDDDNPCTKGETCTAGKGCGGGVPICECTTYEDCALKDDGNPCNGTLMCDQAAGKCVLNPTSLITCDPSGDGPCEQTACDPGTGSCTTKPRKPKTPCEDGNPCSLDEACDGLGNCVAGKNICACQATADCAALEDGDACNGTLFCDKTKLPWTCKVNPATVVVCPDNLDQPCLANLCDKKSGQCANGPVADGKTCDDGDLCTKGDVCKAGVCSAGTDICGCNSDSDCASQEDGDLCNGTLYCNLQSHTCELNPATKVFCPANDPKACVGWSCDKLAGKCVQGPVPDGASCDDGSACTKGETCAKGVCTPSANTCECKVDTDCASKEDGNACNGTLFCNKQSGKCEVNPATVKSCPSVDDTACTKNTCNPKTGACAPKAVPENAPCDDGSSCTLGDHCVKGQCAAGSNLCACKDDGDCVNQDDGDLCNGTLFCNKTTGSCDLNPATVVVCPSVDDTLCVKNTCQAKTGKCAMAPVNQGLACDDGNPCTKSDSCLAGKCQPGANTCECQKDADCAKQEDDNPCTGPLFCDKSGQTPKCAPNPAKDVKCSATADTKCLKNLCNPKTGKCAMTPVNDKQVCAPGTLCAAVQICDAGTCKKGAPLDCNDGNPCTIDSCDDFKGCLHKQTNGVKCDDGNKCTIEDLCVQGFCTGTTTDCNDESPCTQDLCAPLLGCQYFPKGGSCSDDDACTYGDTCKAGQCIPGSAVSCDDGNVCTADSCDPAKGCVGAPLDKTCTDGDACTKGDKCVLGVCFPGDKDDCDDKNTCTEDSCDSKKGCAHKIIDNGTECDDGDLCTVSDACKAGKCVAKKADCDDDNDCTTDACDPKTGACAFTGVKDGASCHVVGTCLVGNCTDTKRGRVRVPAGQFAMGCNATLDPYCNNLINEKPLHLVELDAYWVDITEASVGSYKLCMKAGACATPASQGSAYNFSAQESDTLPINGLSYEESATYCAWRGGRIPTEAEWEKAARGGCEKAPGEDCASVARTWPSGSKPPPACPDVIMRGDDGKSGCGLNAAAAVGERPSNASPYGALDMAGNVRERVSDYYDLDYYLASPAKNPKGPETGTYRIARGGAWYDSATSVRVSRRSIASNNAGDRYMGVRCVRTALPCDDANPCTTDAIDGNTGKCTHKAADGVACDDGDGCTVSDSCKGGACQPGKARSCDDGNPCTKDACDKAKGTCTFTNEPVGTVCGGSGLAVCAAGNCRWTERGEVFIPGGETQMGCNAQVEPCSSDEKPQHLVDLSPFWMASQEVSVNAYRACVIAGGCPDPATFTGSCEPGTDVKVESADNWPQLDRAAHPMNCVPQTAAAAYCTWIGGRLPTEAEWEMAARGTCASRPDAPCTSAMPRMPWGNGSESCSHQHTYQGGKGAGCGTKITVKVGENNKDISIFGVRQMAGNVSEWTADAYDAGWYAKSPKSDPKLPIVGASTNVAVRGGNLSNLRRLGDRMSVPRDGRRTSVGFRCVRDHNVCDDGDPCTADTWNATTKKCETSPAKNGTPCDDGDPCTTNDACNAGTCKAGAQRDCADDDLCTVEQCNSNTGNCVSLPATDGKTCTADGGVCKSGVCRVSKSGRARALVPKGVFYRGCNATLDSACSNIEKPQHPVSLSGFWMDVNEVSAGDYDKCVKAGKCKAIGSAGPNCAFKSYSRNTTYLKQWDRPVNCLDHAQAKAYCAWAGGRLPSEAEWEKAARGGCGLNNQGKQCAASMPRYPWGAASPTCSHAHMRTNKTGCGTDALAAVGGRAKGVSPYGLHDMAGNVREWTLDSYASYPNSGALQTDPVKTTSSSYVIMRGGDASNTANNLRASTRNYANKTGESWLFGMRCAYDYQACDDNDPCTTDKQDLNTGKCIYTAGKDGLACNDGDECTTADACKAGKCIGKVVACDDGSVCTLDTCDAKLGGCVHTPAKDGLSCDAFGSTCKAGACRRKDGSQILVPAGSFFMGCNAAKGQSCNSDEKPQHEVELSAYWLDRTEVTVASYRQCVAAGACAPPASTDSYCAADKSFNNWTTADRDQHPINCARVEQAEAYCAWTGGRLPTEAEWEKAARGGCERNPGKDCAKAMRLYPWGDTKPDCTTVNMLENNVAGCGTGTTMKVGTKAKGDGPYGHSDLLGNVIELIADRYAANAYANHDDKDPKGPTAGSQRMGRSTAFFWGTVNVGTRSKLSANPNNGTGFRCARSYAKCDDFNPCTLDTLDAKTGKCSHTNADKKACYDGDPCLTGDTCQGGKCVGGSAPRCDDGVPCTVDACDKATGACSHKPAKEGSACAAGGKCTAGVCTHALRGEAYVPAGPFWMGCRPEDKGCSSDEKPLHEVTLKPYWIGLHEVTAGQYRACVDAKKCTAPTQQWPKYASVTYPRPGYEQHPMNSVTYDQAAAYCGFIGGRLPTEAEWEKAARGGCELYPEDCKAKTPAYPWGKDAPTCDHAVIKSGQDGKACATGLQRVGSRKKDTSPYGARDLIGNVIEWVQDGYVADYYSKSPKSDPKSTSNTKQRVLRGDNNNTVGKGLRTSNRGFASTGSVSGSRGFRCVRDVASCDDGNACTFDKLDSKTGKCSNTPMSSGACDDGNPCTSVAWCKSGACQAGKAINCDDGNSCTVDTCDAKLGSCVSKPVTNGTACGSSGAGCQVGACVSGTKGMTLVPAGAFWMGCDAGDPSCNTSAQPGHEVTLKKYYIDIEEVRVEDFEACIKAGKCTKPDTTSVKNGCDKKGGKNNYLEGRDAHPINCVNYWHAVKYCLWKKKRLPTEAEWEKAARGGCELYDAGKCKEQTPHYPWGTKAASCDLAWYSQKTAGCGTNKTTHTYKLGGVASPYGTRQQAGNVMEYVADFYSTTYYASSPKNDPKGPSTGTKRVLRGGNFTSGASSLAVYRRVTIAPTNEKSTTGFRCVME